MVHIIFNGSDVRLENFYQVGGSGLSFFEGLPLMYQRGYGHFTTGYPLFRQRGNGLGDIFRSLWRVLKPIASNIGHTIVPLAKQAGQALGQEGIATSAKVLNKIVEGSNPKEALISEGKEATSRLLERANQSLQRKLQRGTGCHRQGYKRAKKRGTQIICKPIDYIGRTVSLPKAKKQRKDNLGYY